MSGEISGSGGTYGNTVFSEREASSAEFNEREASSILRGSGLAGDELHRRRDRSTVVGRVACREVDAEHEWSRRRRRGHAGGGFVAAKALVRSNFLSKGSRTRVIHLGRAAGPGSPFAWCRNTRK